MQLKKNTNNYLLYWGLVFFVIGGTLLVLFEQFNIGNERSSKSSLLNHFSITIFIYGVFLAPIIEEFCMRGIFTGKKYFKYFFYVGVPLFVLLSSNYYLLPLVAIFILFFELKKDRNLILLYFLSSIIFSFNHYKFFDLFILKSYPSIIAITGIGLVLTWIVINFGLLYSIFAHAFVNFLAMISILIPYELSVGDKKVLETESFIMEYETKSFFTKSENSTIKTDQKNFLVANNSNFEIINSSICPSAELNGIYFGKYNVSIRRKKGAKKILDCKTLQQLLIKSEIGDK